MITSQNRPGLPDFSRVTLKNMGRPGDEASASIDHRAREREEGLEPETRIYA